MKRIIALISVLFVAASASAIPTPLFPYYFGVSNNVITTAPISLTPYPLQLQPVTIFVQSNATWQAALLNTNQLVIPIRESLDTVNWVTNNILLMPQTNSPTFVGGVFYYTFVFTPTNIPVYADAVAYVTNNTANPVFLNGTYGY